MIVSLREKKIAFRFDLTFSVECLIFSLFAINTLSILETRIGNVASNISQMCYVLIFISILMNAQKICRSFDYRIMLVFTILIVLLGLNYLMPAHEMTRSTIISYLLSVMPMILVAYAMDVSEKVIDRLIQFSSYIIICAFGVIFIAGNNAYNYSMGFANSLLLPIILKVYDYYKHKKRISLLFAMLGGITIIMIGSRGPFFGIATLILLILLRGVRDKKRKGLSITIILVIIISMVFFNQLVDISISFAERLGINSRTLWILKYDPLHSSGRDIIYKEIIEKIFDNPLAVRGIAGDRVLSGGAYAHNITLELIAEFGIVLGGAMTLYIVVEAVRTSIRFIRRGSPAIDFKTMLMCASLPGLLVSNTLWASTIFWMWIFIDKRRKPWVLEEESQVCGIMGL